jgi:hypothetical protein
MSLESTPLRFCEIYAGMRFGEAKFIGDELEMSEETFQRIFEFDPDILCLYVREMGTHRLLGMVVKNMVME